MKSKMISMVKGMYAFMILLCLLYVILRLGMLVISLLGYDIISPSDGKEFVVGTLIPDFFFLFISCIFSFLYFKHSKAVFAIHLIVFIILLLSIIPRLYMAKTYQVIAGENSKSDYAISYTLHKVAGEEYDSYTIYTYKKVLPFIYQPWGEYSYEGSQYGNIKKAIYEKNYEIKNGITLILDNFDIPLQ